MSKNIWEKKGWPIFYWDQSKVAPVEHKTFFNEGFLNGLLSTFENEYKLQFKVENISTEIETSWKIENENLDSLSVYSSVCRKLNIEDSIKRKHSSQIEGIVEITLDAIDGKKKTLDSQRLFEWHSKMFPSSISGGVHINKGKYRESPIDVLEGEFGKERILFTAVPAKSINNEMEKFFTFINENNDYSKFVKSAIAHLWFVTIHPFEDGNGRIARTISDFVLYQKNMGYSFYSISAQIKLEQKEYYKILNTVQTNDSLDITEWLIWYLNCLSKAILTATEHINLTIRKEKFYKIVNDSLLNDRQLKMIKKITEDWEGKITSKKWSKICNCSVDTSTRDLNDLINKGLFKKNSSGPSTSYELLY